jgi:Flp pilus assembly pilin Flp
MLDRIRAQLRALCGDRSGATAIEYAMVVVFIGILLIAAMESIGTSVTGFFLAIASGL